MGSSECCINDPGVFATLGSFFGLCDIRCVSEGYAVFITFFLAIVVSAIAFIANYHQRKREYRNQNSSQFLAIQSKSVMDALKKLGDLTKGNMTDIQVNAFINSNYQDFMTVVAHFENASVYMSTGYASERLILRVERTNMIRFMEAIFPYIKANRPLYNNILIYYECLYIRCIYTRTTILGMLISLVTLFSIDRFKASRMSFLFYYRVLHELNLAKKRNYMDEQPAETLRYLRPFRFFRYVVVILAAAWLIHAAT